ncbi:hypothetical protein EIP86_008777 [Pleurotus ostreatoroseus]|nr:hypothetical protein EIP86_008777 [Pleurotus ostreatoroseus]
MLNLIINTQSTSPVLIKILTQCTQVERLTLELAEFHSKTLIPCFEHLARLTHLAITHTGDIRTVPLSERLVVSIAASVPNLYELSIQKVGRSAFNASDLIEAGLYAQVVLRDTDIPPHALLGADLSLPSLLRLPTLKRLRIHDTDLGDPQWVLTPISCSLELLDLSNRDFEPSERDHVFAEHIVGKVGHTVEELCLSSPISKGMFSLASVTETPLKHLRRLRLTSLFPVEKILDTLETLSGSPVEEVHVHCRDEDDFVCLVPQLHKLLRKHFEDDRSTFYPHLTHINDKPVLDEYEDLLLFADS